MQSTFHLSIPTTPSFHYSCLCSNIISLALRMLLSIWQGHCVSHSLPCPQGPAYCRLSICDCWGYTWMSPNTELSRKNLGKTKQRWLALRGGWLRRLKKRGQCRGEEIFQKVVGGVQICSKTGTRAGGGTLKSTRVCLAESLWQHELQHARILCPCIFQVRILQQVAISYSRRSSQPRDQTCVSCISCTSREIL